MFIAGFLVVSTMVPVPFVWFVRKFKIMRFEPDPSQQVSIENQLQLNFIIAYCL